jgi:hypothetical protein
MVLRTVLETILLEVEPSTAPDLEVQVWGEEPPFAYRVTMGRSEALILMRPIAELTGRRWDDNSCILYERDFDLIVEKLTSRL